MPLFVLILLLPAAITIAAKAMGAIPSNRAAAGWIVASGCAPALIYLAIILATGGSATVAHPPIVIVVGIAVAWLGFAAWPLRWRRGAD